METRKIQKTGGSTYIVSLPKTWAKNRIEEGDQVFVSQEGDSIRVSVQEDQENQTSVSLDYEEPLGALLRKIIAHYLVGYDIIKIRSSQVIPEKDKLEKLVREKMLGLEVTGESAKEIKLQNLLKYSDLPTRQVLVRMDSIIKSMYKDILNSFTGDGSQEVLQDVIKRENEIDRLYLLGVRQIKSAIRDRDEREKLGIDSKLLCLGYRIIFKSLERIGDHLAKISKFLLDLEKETFQKEQVLEVGRDSLEVYQGVADSFFKYDGDLAEKYIQKSKKIDREAEGINDLKEKMESHGYYAFKSILNSIGRTRKLSRDIAEIVINLSAGET